MTAPLLPPARPDLTEDYWHLKQFSTDTVVEQNGCRVNVDLLHRVLLARRIQEQHQGAAVAVEDGR